MCCARAPDARTLEAIFDGCFSAEYATQLRGGAAEPLYTPATRGRYACIHYREDYAASALHEVAHWCIAGHRRRQQRDYGYWYNPEGRNAAQQQRFQQVEAKPQALEWHFARASGMDFRLSLDNLEMPVDEQQRLAFARQVHSAALRFQDRGLPPRAQRYVRALLAHTGRGQATERVEFSLEALL